MKHPPRNIVIDWLNTIWETNLPPSSKLVACCLRRYMNAQNDMAWPSVARIAGECGLSERSVQRHLQTLCIEGWLHNAGNSNTGTVKYQAATPAKMSPPADLSPPQICPIPPADLSPELNKELNNTLSLGKWPFTPPLLTEVRQHCLSKQYDIDAESFIAFYDSKGWMIGKNKMKCWKSALTTWHKRSANNGNTKNTINGVTDSRRLSPGDRTRQLREQRFAERAAAGTPDMGCVGDNA